MSDKWNPAQKNQKALIFDMFGTLPHSVGSTGTYLCQCYQLKDFIVDWEYHICRGNQKHNFSAEIHTVYKLTQEGKFLTKFILIKEYDKGVIYHRLSLIFT
jgi:hypothetical protein